MTDYTGSPGSGTSICPGCGLSVDESAGPAPEEHLASAGCWELYGQVLARSYTSAGYRAVHQMVVDAYAAQHAGGTSRREVQSVGLCLMTLCLFIEDGVDPAQGPALHKQMVANRPHFIWLAPPERLGPMTVANVLSARGVADHCRLVREWGLQLWQAWTPHHTIIRGWNNQALS